MDPPTHNDGSNDALDVVMGATDASDREDRKTGLLSRKRKTSGNDNDGTSVASAMPDDHFSHAKKTRVNDAGRSAADRSHLPAEIWHHVFTFCPPRTLGNLLSVNKLFNSYLDPASSVPMEKCPSPLETSATKVLEPNAIWKSSRRAFWPKMPGPMKGKTELDMWRLACLSTCQFCGKRDTRQPLPTLDPLRLGPGLDGVATIWLFRVRCCGACLSRKTLTEMDLILSAGSTFLIPALQFVLVSQNCIVPLSAIERGLLPPSSTLTKLYWSSDVEALREEFASVRELGASAAEEWQKGLSTRGSDQRADIAKWEKYADSGGVANMKSLLYPSLKPHTTASGTASVGEHTRPATAVDKTGSSPPARLDLDALDAPVLHMADEKIEKIVTSVPLPFSGKEKTREEIDAEWDLVQGPVRLKILKYADEAIIGDWDDGDKVTKHNAPAFAADVLLHVRKRFYMEVEKDAKEARAAGREPIVDPIDGPFTQKLSLENMKYVFDVKVKPITSKFRNDLFLCPSCDANFKFFGFEGAIQHYAAKHTSILSVGNIIVYWRAEWPEDPPFRANPRANKATGQPLPLTQSLPPRPATHRSPPAPAPYPQQTGFSQYSASNAWAPQQSLLPPPPPSFIPPPPSQLPYPPLHYQPFQPGVHAHQFPAAGGMDTTPFVNAPHTTGPPQALPPQPLSYMEPAQPDHEPRPFQQRAPPVAYQPHVEDAVHGTGSRPVGVNSAERVASAAVSTSQPTIPAPPRSPRQHRDTLPPSGKDTAVSKPEHSRPSVPLMIRSGEVIREVHRIWSDVFRLKSVPGVVRAFTLLYHANKFHLSKFGDQLPLHFFSDGIFERKDLKSMKSICDLPCKACNRRLGQTADAKSERALFTFPQLLNHFAKTHAESRHSATGPHAPLSWLEDMLLLPQNSILATMASNAKKQGKVSWLLSEAIDDFLTKENYVETDPVDSTRVVKNSIQPKKEKEPTTGIIPASQPAAPTRITRSSHSSKVVSDTATEQAPRDKRQTEKTMEQPRDTPAAVIKREPLKQAEVATRDVPKHDAMAPVQESQDDLLGALEMHLKGAPVQPVSVRRDMASSSHGQARVVYVDEYGRELVPRRTIQGPIHGGDGYPRYAADERGRPGHRYVDQLPEYHAEVSRHPYGQYRDRSPLPARRYADDPDYAVHPRDFEEMHEQRHTRPSAASPYSRHGPPPPRQECYEDYTGENERRAPSSCPLEYDRYEAYELVRMADSEGEYYVRCPVRREIPQATSYRKSGRYYSPAPPAAGGRAMLRHEYGEGYPEPGYGVPHEAYANSSRYDRGPALTRVGNGRTGAAPPPAEHRTVQTDPAFYDEYDPHNPTAGSGVTGDADSAASRGGRHHMQYH